MRIIFKILNYFFVFLGVIFLGVLLAATYLYIADPFGIKPMFSTFGAAMHVEREGDTPVVVPDGVDANPMLDEKQEAALESVGIDPAAVPSEITPEMEQCFESALGEQRVGEIKAGDDPSMADLFKARGCINN